MIDQQILMAVAQIAIALSGFSGIVASYKGKLAERRRQELKTLLQQSGIALFASLAPLIFSSQSDGSYRSGDYEQFWMISSVIYITVCSAFLLYWGLEIWGKDRPKSEPYDFIFFILFCGVVAMLAVNVTLVRDGYLYFLALAINLVYGFVTFVRLVTVNLDNT